jgi:hypothetical protein
MDCFCFFGLDFLIHPIRSINLLREIFQFLQEERRRKRP